MIGLSITFSALAAVTTFVAASLKIYEFCEARFLKKHLNYRTLNS